MESPSRVVVAAESEIILPAPTVLNPVPSLPVALRVDNQDQVLTLLQSDPPALVSPATVAASTGSAPAAATATSGKFRQLLVFGTASLRTLLLRQVVSDPHTRTFQGKKKNWDEEEQFPLPKDVTTIVGTRVLLRATPTFTTSTVTSAVTATGNPHGGAAPVGGDVHHDDDGANDYDDCGGVDVVTYFLSPADLQQTQRAIQRIRRWKKTHRTHHRLVYVPQYTALIQKVILNAGLTAAPNVSLHKLQLDVFPLETDVLSMEYADAYREVMVENTPSPLITAVARSLRKIQDICGPIPRIQALGPLGEEVTKKLLSVTVDEYLAAKEQPHEETGPVPAGDIAAVVILDRSLDLVTPMITPLTYEGLLDDVVGIDCGFITVDVDTINPPDESSGDPTPSTNPFATDTTPTSIVVGTSGNPRVALGVNGSDSLYNEVRNQHVEKFGTFLQNQAKALRESHANFTDRGKKKDLQEIHQFVKNIPIFTRNLRSLTNHIHLAELVKKTSEETTFRERWQLERSILEGETCYDILDDLVASQYPPYRFLRLLCLQSLCSGGIRSSRYDSLRRDVVQTYGYEFLFLLGNLERAGLLRRRDGLWIDSASPFNSLRKSLVLIHPEVDTVEPDDISYVSSGYAPLSVRLIQTAMKGWTGREDILKELLPNMNRVIDIVQQNPPEDFTTALKRSPPSAAAGGGTLLNFAETLVGNSSVTVNANHPKKPVLLVTYVGGVTFTELAALRFLSARPTFPYRIICLTTKITNGNTFLESLTGRL